MPPCTPSSTGSEWQSSSLVGTRHHHNSVAQINLLILFCSTCWTCKPPPLLHFFSRFLTFKVVVTSYIHTSESWKYVQKLISYAGTTEGPKNLWGTDWFIDPLLFKYMLDMQTPSPPSFFFQGFLLSKCIESLAACSYLLCTHFWDLKICSKTHFDM